jgi:hypothetical protein
MVKAFVFLALLGLAGERLLGTSCSSSSSICQDASCQHAGLAEEHTFQSQMRDCCLLRSLAQPVRCTAGLAFKPLSDRSLAPYAPGATPQQWQT